MKVKELMKIVIDSTARDDEKDDAIIELGNEIDNEEVVDFLICISNNPDYDDMIKASCGESLGYIWSSRDKIDFTKLQSLNKIALIEALGILGLNKPEWL